MEKILLFAGTTEGRVLARLAAGLGYDCTVSTATEYGDIAFSDIEGVRRINGRMDQEAIESLIRQEEMTVVIDATHPFARVATRHIQGAAQAAGVLYVRCLRAAKDEPEENSRNCRTFASLEEAVAWLDQTTGNILAATGSKEIAYYTRIKNYRQRCYARVLSTVEAVRDADAAGFYGRHLLAMQGPFSEEMNIASLRHVNASYFVTKESGKAGGFDEKLSAAKKAGVTLVVIRRPKEAGYTLEEVEEMLRTGGFSGSTLSNSSQSELL